MKARFEKELAEETERNKDDIAHLEALEKHYVERGKAYEVGYFTIVRLLTCLTVNRKSKRLQLKPSKILRFTRNSRSDSKKGANTRRARQRNSRSLCKT